MITGHKNYYHYLLLFILIYFVVFLKLDSFHMRWWDESMFSVNTYEMLHNGKYFSLYFNGVVDNFNTKPPLTIWIQLIFVKILGYNELALRLPSAISAALTILIIFHFLKIHFSLSWAWLTALILLTSQGFVYFHTARTGDADALLTLFLTAANLCFIKYLVKENKKDIFLFFLFISLAFATKLYAALLFCPAYLLILTLQNKLKDFILNKYFLFGIGLFIAFGTALILLRESDSPGYLKEILFKDAGRLFSAIEDHEQPFDFYIRNLFSWRFSTWFLLIFISIFFYSISLSQTVRTIVGSSLGFTLSYLLIISISRTKLEWYDMPLFPFMAITAGYSLFKISEIIFAEHTNNSLAMLVLIACIFAIPYYQQFDKAEANTLLNEEKSFESSEALIFKYIKENKSLNGVKVLYSRYIGSLLFYKYRLAEKNQSIEVTKDPSFFTGDKVLVCDKSLLNIMNEKYIFEIIDTYNDAKLVTIKSVMEDIVSK